jgi:hypothetical protein
MIHREREFDQWSPDPKDWVDPLELASRVDEAPQVQIIQQAMECCHNGSQREVTDLIEDGPCIAPSQR